MLDDVKRVEEDPEGMRRIGQAAVSESVGGEQIAELVVHLGLRHGHPRQQRQARKDGHRANCRQRKPLAFRELTDFFLDPGEDRLAQSGPGPGESNRNRENHPV